MTSLTSNMAFHPLIPFKNLFDNVYLNQQVYDELWSKLNFTPIQTAYLSSLQNPNRDIAPHACNTTNACSVINSDLIIPSRNALLSFCDDVVTSPSSFKPSPVGSEIKKTEREALQELKRLQNSLAFDLEQNDFVRLKSDAIPAHTCRTKLWLCNGAWVTLTHFDPTPGYNTLSCSSDGYVKVWIIGQNTSDPSRLMRVIRTPSCRNNPSLELHNWLSHPDTELRIQIPGDTIRIEECQVHVVFTSRVIGGTTVAINFLHDVAGSEKAKTKYNRFYRINRESKVTKSSRPQRSTGEKKPRKVNPKSLGNLRQFKSK